MPACKTCGGELQDRYDEVIPVQVTFDEQGEEDSCESLDEYLYRHNPYVLCEDCGAMNADTGHTVRTMEHGRFRLDEIEAGEVSEPRSDEQPGSPEIVSARVCAQYFERKGVGSYQGGALEAVMHF